MQVADGYKLTEVGVIPEEWTVKPLGDEIVALEAGVSVNSLDSDRPLSLNTPAILKTSAVEEGYFHPHECKAIATRDIGRARLNPRADSILISRMNTIDLVGECGFVRKDYPNLFVPDRLWMTRLRVDSQLSAHWMTYVLSSTEYRKKLKTIATGTSGSMKNIAKSSLLSLAFAFPPLPEQRAIAKALSDVDALINALDALITKKRHIKQGTMQQLLTGKKRLPGFSGEWESALLGEVADIRMCKRIFAEQTNPSGEIPFFKIGTFGGIPDAFISFALYDEYRRKYSFPRKGDILLSAAGTLGKTVIYDGCDAYFQDSNIVWLDVDKQKIANEYLYQCYQRIEWESPEGSTISRLYNGIIRATKVPLPPLAEQRVIAKTLSDMDFEIEALEQKRNKTKLIKQGMMQELLTGKTRLV
jgi:type I restriction enzyme, S subunit